MPELRECQQPVIEVLYERTYARSNERKKESACGVIMLCCPPLILPFGRPCAPFSVDFFLRQLRLPCLGNVTNYGDPWAVEHDQSIDRRSNIYEFSFERTANLAFYYVARYTRPTG